MVNTEILGSFSLPILELLDKKQFELDENNENISQQFSFLIFC